MPLDKIVAIRAAAHVAVLFWMAAFVPASLPAERSSRDRSPVDLVLAPDETWLLTANQTSGTVSLVRTADGKVLDEVPCGDRPVALSLDPTGRRVVVTASDSGDVHLFEIADAAITSLGKIDVGFEPHGIAVAPDGQTAYVALTAAAAVAVLDLDGLTVLRRIEVARWPRYLALSPDGKRLAVGTSGDRGVSVVDPHTGQMLYMERFSGLNVGHLSISQDGRYAYFPWMVYRQNPIAAQNIRRGWVLASRIGRVRLDGPARREAISLDPEGKAVADPHGLDISGDGRRLVVSASGTHELLLYRLPDLPFIDYGGPGDHIEPDLLADRDRFDRIPLGGRPMGLKIAGDDRTVYVANYLANSVQVVDLDQRRLVKSFFLGGPPAPSSARRGEAIFYDARRSFDQWYSCHSCHYNGGTNAVTMDTLNDGTPRTFKSVLPLYNVDRTAPWTWHGWQDDLEAGIEKSLRDTMVGPEPEANDVSDVVRFLQSLALPPNPHRLADGSLSPAAHRGERVFQSDRFGCGTCHRGLLFTDGQVHNVGTGQPHDRYDGFNTPSLLGLYRRVKLLHDGRVDSLRDLLTGPHNPAAVSGSRGLDADELDDLIAYLKSL